MAMEVPVLATRSGGMEAFAKHGEDAWLVDPNSVDELERGLDILLTGLTAILSPVSRARPPRSAAPDDSPGNGSGR